MDRGVADSAVLVPDRCLVVERRHTRRFDLVTYGTVAFEAHLSNGASVEHLRVRRAVWRMTCGAALRF